LPAKEEARQGLNSCDGKVWFALLRTDCIVTTVNRLRTFLSLSLALLWLPVTVHCLLESLPGIEFLSCCQHDDSESEPATAHQDNDCETDACASVESGFYKIEDNLSVSHAVHFVLSVWESVAALPGDFTPDFSPASSAPPELPKVWQFSRRTALPPRAPSFIA
jgi:hypothetical protein